MLLYRKQLILISIVTLSIALILTIISLVTFNALLSFFIILVIAISLLADAILLLLLFRQKEGLLQLFRGCLLVLLFLIIIFNYLLHRF